MQATLSTSRSSLLAQRRFNRAGVAKQPVAVCKAAAVAAKSVSGALAEVKKNKKVAFIPFITAGDPDLETTEAALKRLDNLGSDVIELGVPYSDPLADGPVIQGAATRALEAGVTLEKVLELVKRVTPTLKAPLVLFTYYNPIIRRGIDAFCKSISEAGASGLLVPDIPLEETPEVRKCCTKYGLELILLTTPTTSQARMKEIAKASQGFVYLVSITGVTGVKDTMETRVKDLVKMLQSVTDKPICVGFGVSKPEQATQIKAWGADGVICGSALVKALVSSKDKEEGLAAMEAAARALRDAI